MDILSCAALSLGEVQMVNSLSNTKSNNPQLFSFAAILFLGQYLLLKIYRVFLFHRYFSPFRHLPGPKDNHFLFGQSINFLRAESPNDLYIQWMKQWPDAPVIRYLGFFNREVLVVNSLDSYKNLVQTNCYAMVKPGWWRGVTREIVGDGIIVMEGDEHRTHRKMLSGVLSAPSVKKLEPVVWEKAREVGRLFDSAIAADPDGKTGVIPSTDTFSKFTLDIMGRITLGFDMNHLGSAAEAYRQSKSKSPPSSLLSRAHPSSPPVKDEYTFHEAYMSLFGQSNFGNFLLFVNAYFPVRWLPLEANRRYLRGTKWIHDTLLSLIRKRQEEVRRDARAGRYEKQNSRDMLTFLVEETLPGGPAEGLKENHFLGHILQLMAGGVDTTANMIAWSSYVLAKNHDIQDKLQAEILDFLSRVPNPTYPDIDTLPYLNGFVKEMLRVYCPGKPPRHFSPSPLCYIIPPTNPRAATTIHRQARQPVVLDGVPVPQGTEIDAAFAMPLRNPRIWGADAHEVKPERWLRPLTAAQKSPYAFPCFSNGPRMCIGKNLAYLEMKVVLVEIVRQYRFVRVVTEPTLHSPSLLLHGHGLEVCVERIGGV
ncbi:cytochrome P450 [Apiospora marii]|uniref:Cytochrome P450 n=1 Tax=Apiospora marii TaxID=335849 RepID=A0ABR1SGZ5_9PEZI